MILNNSDFRRICTESEGYVPYKLLACALFKVISPTKIRHHIDTTMLGEFRICR